MVETEKKYVKNCVEYGTTFSSDKSLTRFRKKSNKRAATAQNINNMKMGPILRHTTLFPPHPGIEFSPWKRVNSANTSLQNLYYEISCYIRNGQNFHISTHTHFYHFAILAQCSSGYRLQLLSSLLTIFNQYTDIQAQFGKYGRPCLMRSSPLVMCKRDNSLIKKSERMTAPFSFQVSQE